MQNKPELTARAVLVAVVVSTIVAFSYPYVVLKLGLGPNVSVLSAFLGAAVLGVIARRTRGANALQNNLVQTAGTSAGSTAFMCVVLAAFGYLDMNPNARTHIRPDGLPLFAWLFVASVLGVVIAAIYRKRFLVDPSMKFVDGQVAATTIQTLDSTDPTAKRGLRVLASGALLGALLSFLRDGLGKITLLFIYRPLRIGVEWSLLSFGSGLLLPWQMGIWMLGGVVLTRVLGPTIVQMAAETVLMNSVESTHVEACRAIFHGTIQATPAALAPCGSLGAYLHGSHSAVFLMWAMWPATMGMIVAEVTKMAVGMLRDRTTIQVSSADTSSRSNRRSWIVVAILTGVLALIQRQTFGMPMWMTVLGVAAGVPIVLVGVRVLGQTNLGPVSVMANALQAIFRLVSPHTGFNLVTAGTAGCVNAQGEGTMQDFKTGEILGSNPRLLTWMQILGSAIGALGVVIMYPLLVARYPLGEGLAAPTGLKLANMAMLLARGLDAFPPGALRWTLIAAGLAVLFTLAANRSRSVFVPNVTALAIALILPGFLTVPMAVGAIVGGAWERLAPEHHARYAKILASGVVGGEAFVGGLVLPVLFTLGWLTPP